MIKAIKDGLEANFSDRAWKIGNPEKHGWVKMGVKSDAVTVKVEPIPIVDDVEITTDEDLYPTDDEMKDELTKKGVKFHRNIGRAKLKIRYDDSKK